MQGKPNKIMQKRIEEILTESINIEKQIIAGTIDIIEKIAHQICTSLRKGGKIIIFGNGGSAADAQHIAAEFVGRFQKERRGLAAIALNTNTSILTALSNDYGYENVFKRQIEALADEKDIVLAISTSGTAKNVNEAVKFAASLDIKTIALSGKGGGELAKLSDTSLIVPSEVTARIQETHITIGHIICQLVEEELFKD